jgi:hypothetical protein
MATSRSEEKAAGPVSAAALSLAAEGHPVLPLHTPRPASGCSCRLDGCSNAGKHPRAGLGLRFASRNPETVAAWWVAWPDANIGLRCDGLVVFDIDGPTGEVSLEELKDRLGPLPETRAQSTGKGRHLLYAVPTGTTVGNSTRRLGSPAGIDLRSGMRGYIVAAPSRHASGPPYAWIDPERPVSDLPAAYLGALTRPESSPSRAAATRGPTTAYGRAALHGELERLLRAPVGDRNNALNVAVFRLAQLVAGGELDEDELKHEALAFGCLISLERHEVKATVRSALRAGLRTPRRRGEGGTIGGVG